MKLLKDFASRFWLLLVVSVIFSRPWPGGVEPSLPVRARFVPLSLSLRSLLMSVLLGGESPEMLLLVTPFPDLDMISRPECVSLLSSYDVESNKL